MQLNVFVRRDELWLSVDRDLSFGAWLVPHGARLVGARPEGELVAVVPPAQADVVVVVPFKGVEVPCETLRLWRSTVHSGVGRTLVKPLAVSVTAGSPTVLVVDAGVQVDVRRDGESSRVLAQFEDGSRIEGWTSDRPEFPVGLNAIRGRPPGSSGHRRPPETRVLTQCSRALPLLLGSASRTIVLGTLDVGTRFLTGSATDDLAPIVALESDAPFTWPDGTRLLVHVADLSSCAPVGLVP
jgi:hypothetical protein